MTQAPEQPTARGWRPDDSTFGARLALIRQRMQWGNVREAAIACGVPTESWRTWERDGVTPRRIVEMSTLIANATGCDLGWLIAGPAMAGRMEVAEQVNGRSAPISRSVPADSTPRRTKHRPTARVSAGQRRPVSVRSPGYSMSSAHAA
jgi:hypothetical protein